jgi:PIN domain nuclease of toxin-antitoxin system
MAGLLVDSHVLLWHVLDDPRLGPEPTAAIEANDSQVYVSTASIWEIAIKAGLGKLDAPDDLPARCESLGFELLAVTVDHAWRVRSLPHHHGDPFDRLLIAQAQAERLPIVTADPAFREYDVTIVWDAPGKTD